MDNFKIITLPPNSVFITKDIINVGVILISHNHCDQLEYNIIEY